VPPSDFIKNMSQAPSKGSKQRIKVDELDCFMHHSIRKILFVLGADEWKAKLESAYSFILKNSKITV
jgi:hypothetical protein